jgi:hypothetical protein
LEKIIFENSNSSENNITSVKLAKVLGYYLGGNASNMDKLQTTIGQGSEPVSCKYIFYPYIPSGYGYGISNYLNLFS